MLKIIRLFFIVAALASAMVMVACGTEESSTLLPLSDNDNTNSNLIDNMRAEFLSDLDYMQRVLEENFASFDVVYWARGVDIKALLDSAREDVLAAAYLDLNVFGNILLTNFFEFYRMANFFIDVNLGISDNALDSVQRLSSKYSNEKYFDIGLVVELIILEEIVQFGFEDESAIRNRLGRVLRMEIENDMFDAFMMGGADLVLGKYFEILYETGYEHISLQILEEGKIAYMNIKLLTRDYSYFGNISSFYSEIYDYEHLIIDLRGNPGGAMYHFDFLVVAPLINELMRAEGFAFLSNGEYVNVQTIQSTSGSMGNAAQIELESRVWTPISEALFAWDIPNLNMEDMARMDYANRIYKEIEPRPLTDSNPELSFNGKIWVLTDEFMGSATQVASWFIYESGFATLVGNTTGGNFAGTRTTVMLPNTRVRVTFDMLYLTDTNGRPLEAGTVPHYFNRQGMDALQTVLAMIEDGQY